MAPDKGMAPQEQPLPGPGPQKGLETVDTKESSVFRPREASEDHHPHACTDGLVFLTYTANDEDIGDEVERLEVVACCHRVDSR
jgi:hypothetical protein